MAGDLGPWTRAPRHLLKGVPSPTWLSELAIREGNRDRTPPIDVRSIATEFGISNVVVRAGLKTAGQLEVCEGTLCILLPARTDERRNRFTIAHELAHYLLAVECGLSLSRQVGERQVESYCNAFASQLLIPHWWLRENWPDAPISLDTVESVANQTQTNRATAASALTRSLTSWRSLFMLWRRYKDSWYAPTCISPSGRPVPSVEATEHTGKFLEKAIQNRLRSHRVPMCVDGKQVTIECEMAPIDNGVAMLAHTT
jgi:hypothetical protein